MVVAEVTTAVRTAQMTVGREWATAAVATQVAAPTRTKGGTNPVVVVEGVESGGRRRRVHREFELRLRDPQKELFYIDPLGSLSFIHSAP